jgi:tetratricopeptide (TPR) repeat protein
MSYYQLALQLANDETSTDDINIVRYFLCYLYYLEKDYYKAALMGEFVAQRYPDSAGARQCAKIAMACYIQIYGETNQMAGGLFAQLDQDSSGGIAGEELKTLPDIAQGADKDADEKITSEELADRLVEFDVAHIVSIAEYIADKWAEQPEAEEALNTLVPFMINAGELDRAQQFLARIPESSPKRGDSELKTGQAMWGTYLRESQKFQEWKVDGPPAGVDVVAKREEHNNLKVKAIEILAAGYGRLQETTPPTRTIVTALLSLAQAYLESQQAPQAVEVLENATFGPLVLVNKKDPSATDPAVVEEIYKTALRAYISSLGGADGSVSIDKAKDVMDKMKSALGGDAEGEKRLVAVYVNLARDLEKQLESATPEVKRALSLGFETFLRQLSEGASELSVLNWVAESYSKLGKSLDDGQALNEDAKKYYQASVDAFQNIIDKVELEPNMKVQVQLRMASVQGEMRDFEKAVGMFENILGANANALNVQVEAAKLIELWAKQPGQEEKYKAAIVGIRKEGEPKPVIWGWGGIAQKTAGNAKFKDTFYEARLRLAQCRYDHAMRLDGAEKDKKMNSAKQDISITNRLYPELGGEKLKPKFDDLLKKIQNVLGEQPVGLAGP